jgi:DNA repair photolyase
MAQTHVTKARRGTLVVRSTFSNYDRCMNPYVGCQFGCKYCYVRFFIKDKEHDWGQFVRTRDHIHDKLIRELPKHAGQRLVLGTMTDPYQPQEKKKELTRTALQVIAENGQFSKVGIYTRSPLVLRDIDLIKQLPRGRVHFTITPFPREVLKKLEPIPVPTDARFKTVRKLKEAGIRVHVNVSPILPVWSEPYREPFLQQLSEIGVDEFFVDPMQPYKQSAEAVFEAVQDEPDWPKVRELLLDKERYNAWKDWQQELWPETWQRLNNDTTLAIWCDHERKVWINMKNGEQMDWTRYGDDKE